LSDEELEEHTWGDDLDLPEERPGGASMRGSAVATFMAAAVITTAIGLGGSFALLSAQKPEPVRPRFAFTSAPWSVSPEPVGPILSEPLPDVTSRVVHETTEVTTHLAASVRSALALRGRNAAATTQDLLQVQRSKAAEERSRPVEVPVAKPAPSPRTAEPPLPKAKEPTPPPEPDDDALLSGLPGVEDLEATARRLAETEASVAAQPTAVEPGPVDAGGSGTGPESDDRSEPSTDDAAADPAPAPAPAPAPTVVIGPS
jgi:hypothetical protein